MTEGGPHSRSEFPEVDYCFGVVWRTVVPPEPVEGQEGRSVQALAWRRLVEAGMEAGGGIDLNTVRGDCYSLGDVAVSDEVA